MVEYLDGIATSGSSATPINFSMPSDYKRGATSPAFTAFQLYLTDAVDFSYSVKHFDQAWTQLRSGTHSGKVGWNTVRLSKPILGTYLNGNLRIEVNGDVPSPVRYRILSAIGDSGVDVFNNSVRSIIDYKSADNLLTTDAFWMSKPNPSKFAVESLYFDHGSETTIDRMVIDPLTPGLSMSVYYSNDSTASTWDQKLWKRVPHTYHLMFKREIAFPQPISARFIKLEFSSLQLKPYHPGFFETKVKYNKHPKWVLDYFLMDLEQKRIEDSIPLEVNVIQDAYSLAYSYYLDEYQTALPNELGKTDNLSRFLQRSDLTELIDPQMFARIKVAMRPYMSGIEVSRSILGNALQASYQTKFDTDLNTQIQSVMEEFDMASSAILTDVSTLNRETLMNELKCPPMFFFVECRHTYRVAEASFKEHKAYFAGIREIKMLRDQYSSTKSFRTYNETFGDSVNIEINDFA